MTMNTTSGSGREFETGRGDAGYGYEARGGRMSGGQATYEYDYETRHPYEYETRYPARRSEGMDVLGGLGQRLIQNPIPLAVAAIGLGWLLTSNMGSTRRDRYGGRYDYGGYGGADRRDIASADWPRGSTHSTRHVPRGRAGEAPRDIESADWPDTGPGVTDRLRGGVSGAGEGISGAAQSVGSGLSSAAQAVGEAASDAASYVAETAGSVASSAAQAGSSLYSGARRVGNVTYAAARRGGYGAVRYGRRTQRSFVHLVEEEPLLVGAVGLAIGAAVGVALPRTEMEDRYVGPYRDSLREGVERYARSQYENAKEAAMDAYERAHAEAVRQGLTPEELFERLRRLAGTATEVAREEAERHGLAGFGGSPGQSAAMEAYDRASAEAMRQGHTPEELSVRARRVASSGAAGAGAAGMSGASATGSSSGAAGSTTGSGGSGGTGSTGSAGSGGTGSTGSGGSSSGTTRSV